MSLDTALDLITYLKSETHNVPLIQGFGYLEAFHKMVEKRKLSDVTQNVKVSLTLQSLNISVASNMYLVTNLFAMVVTKGICYGGHRPSYCSSSKE